MIFVLVSLLVLPFISDMQVPRYGSVRDIMPFLLDMQVLRYSPVHSGVPFISDMQVLRYAPVRDFLSSIDTIFVYCILCLLMLIL